MLHVIKRPDRQS